MIKIANAPCSWGTLEFEGLDEQKIGYEQMLDELVETGYVGTDLGEWGFLPTNPTELRAAMITRRLTLLSAFVPVNLKDPTAHAEGAATAVNIGKLLAEVGQTGDPHQQPFIVLADDNGRDALRTRHAGRISAEMGLSEAAWQIFTEGATHIAQTVLAETGLKTLFHHHCAGYVETPSEIEAFLQRTETGLLDLVFDTGHYAFGSGSDRCVTEGLHRFADRIGIVHFKDCQPQIAAQARREGWDYFEAIKRGIFCELGQGCVNFGAVVDWLSRHSQHRWAVVEQDVLPGMGSPKGSAQRNRDYLRSLGV